MAGGEDEQEHEHEEAGGEEEQEHDAPSPKVIEHQHAPLQHHAPPQHSVRKRRPRVMVACSGRRSRDRRLRHATCLLTIHIHGAKRLFISRGGGDGVGGQPPS